MRGPPWDVVATRLLHRAGGLTWKRRSPSHSGNLRCSLPAREAGCLSSDRVASLRKPKARQMIYTKETENTFYLRFYRVTFVCNILRSSAGEDQGGGPG